MIHEGNFVLIVDDKDTHYLLIGEVIEAIWENGDYCEPSGFRVQYRWDDEIVEYKSYDLQYICKVLKFE